MDTSKIESNRHYDRAREKLIKHYIPVINEAISSLGNGLKPIKPDDIIIATREEMELIAKEDNGDLHPYLMRIFDTIRKVLEENGPQFSLEMVHPSINALTIGSENQKIVFNAGMEYIQGLNKGLDYYVALNFIPLACHEAGHYSTKWRKYDNETPLANFVRRIELPIIQDISDLLGKEGYEIFLDMTHDIINNIEKLTLKTNGAAICVSEERDGISYYLGTAGYNFNDTLTDWFIDKIKRKSIDEFLRRHGELDSKKVRELLLGTQTKSSIKGVKTYSLLEAKSELYKLGLVDFRSAINAYLSSLIPEIYLRKNPNADAYFS